MANAFLQGILGALQATISVLLVLAYGAAGTRYLPFLSEETVNSVTKVGTNVLLPCLLFTEMGKEAKPTQLKEFWVLPVFNVALTLVALAYSYIGIKFFRMPNWLYPAAAFPNMLSLPLLLIESLSSSGVLDNLLKDKSDSVEDALGRAKIYFLVNGLAGNIVRFALGPYLLNGPDGDDKDGKKANSSDNGERQPLLQDLQPGATIPAYSSTDDGEEEGQAKKVAKKIGYSIKGFLNPPLIAAILAICIGLIGPLRRAFFEEGGALNASFTQSIKTLGKLYTGLQMFVLGGKLVAKKGGKARKWPLLYLFVFRFFIVPAISISIVYGLRSKFPHYAKADPILDFCLAIAYVGPPAITLAALADMAGLDEDEQGVIAVVLLVSYVVTPLMSLSVSTAVSVIGNLYSS